MKTLAILKTGVIVLIFSFVLNACNNGGSGIGTGKLGDTLKDGTFEITVSKIRLLVYGSYITANIKNISQQETDFYYSDFQLVGEDGNIFKFQTSYNNNLEPLTKETYLPDSKEKRDIVNLSSDLIISLLASRPLEDSIKLTLKYQRESRFGESNYPILSWNVEMRVGKSGDTITYEDMEITFNNIEYSEKLFAIDFTIKNKTSADIKSPGYTYFALNEKKEKIDIDFNPYEDDFNDCPNPFDAGDDFGTSILKANSEIKWRCQFKLVENEATTITLYIIFNVLAEPTIFTENVPLL